MLRHMRGIGPRDCVLAVVTCMLSACGQGAVFETGKWARSGDLAVIGADGEETGRWVIGFGAAMTKATDPRAVFAWVCAQPQQDAADPIVSTRRTDVSNSGHAAAIDASFRCADRGFQIRADITRAAAGDRVDDILVVDGRPADTRLGRVFLIDLRGGKRMQQVALGLPTPKITDEQSSADRKAYVQQLRTMLEADPAVAVFFAGR
jgi:hypothetical protein